MYEYSTGFVPELIGSTHSIIKSDAYKSYVQPLSAVVFNTVDFEFGCDFWHEDGSFDFEFVATICDPLRMIARTGSHNSPRFLLLC